MAHDHEQVFSPRLIKAYLDRVTSPEFEKIGVTPSSYIFLMEILHHEGISLKLLSERLIVDKAHTTRMVNRLMEAGFVENTAEGHQYSLRLTDLGHETALKANAINSAAIRELYRDLTPEEMATLHIIMGKILGVIRSKEDRSSSPL